MGQGKAGWHIECSAMSMKYLGETIDIHGGGKDLIFPHHENEIAQSESLTGKQFSKYWLHNGLVKVNGQKMSKSLGNGILLADLLKEYNGDVIKLTLLQNSYRSDINIMDGIFESNESRVYAMYKLLDKINKKYAGAMPAPESAFAARIKEEFTGAMNNDFNTALAVANLFGYIAELTKMVNKNADAADIVAARDMLIEVYGVLRLLQLEPEKVIADTKSKYLAKCGITADTADRKLREWLELKAAKDFTRADEIRNEFSSKGIGFSDRQGIAEWDVIF